MFEKKIRRTNVSGKIIRNAFSLNENDEDQIEVWIDRRPYQSGTLKNPAKFYYPGKKSCKRIEQYMRDNPVKIDVVIYENKEIGIWLE